MKTCNNCTYLNKQKKVHFYVCGNPKSKRFKVPLPHGQTRKACDQTKPKQSSYVDPSQIEGIRFIEDHRGRFQGSEIWVIGTDPNLDCYPDDFFDDKLSITLNHACVAFPNSTYFTGDGSPSATIKDKWPHFMKKYVIPLINRDLRGPTWWETCGLEPLYMKLLTGKSIFAHTEADFERMAEQVFGDGPCVFVGGLSSADFGVQIAAILGARRIIVVGCSATMGDAQKRGLSEFYSGENRLEDIPEYQIGQHPHQIRMRQSTARFAEIFGRRGVEVIKHRFDKEKGEYVFVEIESERENLWDAGWGRV